MSLRHFTSGVFDAAVPAIAAETLERAPQPEPAAMLRAIPNMAHGLPEDPHNLLPQAFLDDLFDLGVFSLIIPKQLGGVGATMADFCRVVRCLAQLDTSAAVTVVPHSGMGVKSLLLFGSPQQQQDVFHNFAAKRGLVAFALTEAGAGSDVANHNSLVVPVGEDQLRLDGNKIWITNAAWAGAIVVCAKCPDLSRIPGGSAFVLVKPGDPGLRISQPYQKMGLLGSTTCQVDFEGMILPRDRLMGKPGMGVQQFNQLVDTGRMGVAAGAVGLVQRLELLAPAQDLALERFAMAAVLKVAALAHDQGFADASLYAALTKCYTTERCLYLVNRALQQHPADFFCSSPLARMLRDTPVLRITEGPNEVLRFRTGVDLAMSRHRKPEGARQLGLLLHEALAESAGIWDGMLVAFEAFAATLERTYDRFVDRQYVLERLVGCAETLWLSWSCLLSAHTMLVQNQPRAAEAVGFTRVISERAARKLEQLITAETQNQDILKEQIFAFHQKS